MTDTLGLGIGGGMGAQIDAFGNTHVSYPGGQAFATTVAAPGANGPGGSVSVSNAALAIIAISLGTIILMGFVFRRG